MALNIDFRIRYHSIYTRIGGHWCLCDPQIVHVFCTFIISANFCTLPAYNQIWDRMAVKPFDVYHVGNLIFALSLLVCFLTNNFQLNREPVMDLTLRFPFIKSISWNLGFYSFEVIDFKISFYQDLLSCTLFFLFFFLSCLVSCSVLLIYLILFIFQIARLQLSESQVGEVGWIKKFALGSVVEGEVTEKKNFGVVISFHNDKDIFGFISHYQCKLP